MEVLLLIKKNKKIIDVVNTLGDNYLNAMDIINCSKVQTKYI